MSTKKPPVIPVEPPSRLPADAAELWRDIVARGTIAPTVDAEMLEAYCGLVIRWRAAAKKITDEGLVVDGGDRRGAVVHPALTAERQLAEQIREWSPLFTRPKPVARRRGPMYDATRRSIAASPKLVDEKRFEAACDAVLTLAWLIDEAQRAGLDALRQATYNLIPTYLKGCAELQITPASMPQEPPAKEKRGKLSKFEDAAARRQAAAG